jgi:hypothetical protein
LRAAEEAADEFTRWRAADFAATILAKLEGAKRSPRQGILIHRLNRALEALDEDFKSDEATLKQCRPRIEKLRDAFLKKSQEISKREDDELWGDNPSPSAP